MESTHAVAEILGLPAYCCRRLSPDRVVCIVTEEWVRQLYQGRVQPLQTDSNFCASVAEKYLARSCPVPPAPWTRLTVKTWPKSQEGIQTLLDSGLTAHTIGDTVAELMGTVARDNLHNLWQAAQNKFTHAHPLSQHALGQQVHHPPRYGSRPQELLSDQMWHWIWWLAPDVHIHVGKHKGQKGETFGLAGTASSSNLQNLLLQNKQQCPDSQGQDQDHMLHSVTRVRVLVETDSSFLLLQPYVEYSLRDVLAYSPAVLDTCHSRPLFLLYQVLQAMVLMHARGLPLGRVSLDTVLLDRDMWVSVLCPQKHALSALMPSPAVSDSGPQEEAEVVEGVHKSSKADSLGMSVGQQSEASVTETAAAGQSVPLAPDRQESSSPPPSPTHVLRQQFSGYTDEDEWLYMEGCEFLRQQGYVSLARCSIVELVDAWVERRLSNFQYLLVLNHLSGRQMNDPNNHPVLPWVMDFSHPHDGYRDLTKSKFRLNKGDRQLDFTFGLESSYSNTGSDNHDPDNIAHHVSDVLSDITYYVYKARRMPKSILCSHVRTVWVPHEYPASMQRLQGWTPDECIPEFFTDPQLFHSIHPDLPDLEIPAWCSSTREFVIWHMATLESDRVSEQLHQWIDLTFGYKLSGKAAVAAKNVYLQLVDGHQTLHSHGVVQLFTQPHPHRLLLSSRQQLGPLRSLRDMCTGWSEEESKQNTATLEISFDNIPSQNMTPESATIFLPLNFDPLVELEHCEALQGFRQKTLLQLQEEDSASQQADRKPRQHALVARDMASFMCLVCEMFLAPRLRMQEEEPSLVKRLQNIRALCGADISMIPRPFQKAVQLLLHDLHVETSPDGSTGNSAPRVYFSPVMTGGLPPPTPSFLLHPHTDVLPFPPYFPSLYACLCRLKATDEAMEEVKRGMESPAEKANMLKQLARSKVPVMEQFLQKWGDGLGKEGLHLVLPLVDSLLADKLTMVQAAWMLFNILSRALGPAQTSHTFLPALTTLLSEGPATAKHIKLYHRTYLMQLLLRLHLQPFLHHFATLLVEAVAGYKDFLLPSRYYSQELLDDLDTADQEAQWVSSASQGVALAEEVEEGELDDVDSAAANGAAGQTVDDDDLDAMSLGDEIEGVGDVLDFSSREECSSISGVSQSSGAGENGEDAVFESDRCSIHSISNIPCRGSGRTHSTTTEEEEDKVYDSPRGGDSGMSKPASASSLSYTAGDSPTHSVDTPTPVMEQSPGLAKGCRSSQQTGPDTSRNDSAQGQKDSTPTKSLHINIVTAEPGNKSTATELEGQSPNLATGCDEGDGLSQSKRKISDSMKRSETEDLMSTLSLNSPTSTVNIRHIAADSVKWLATKLGPVLAARYLSRNLVRMLPLCYLSETQLCSIEDAEPAVVKTSRCVVGDGNASKVLECIGFVASVYGENIILIQYLPSIVDMIGVAQRRFTQRSESGLLAAVILLRFVVPLLSDKTLMDVLEDTIVMGCITPVLNLLTSMRVSFPSGVACRSLLCHKLMDLLYVLGLRLGLEMTRRFLHNPMLVLMDAFSTVHAPDDASGSTSVSPVAGATPSSDESYVTIKMDSLTHQYTIGTPVNPSLLSINPGARCQSPGANMNRWHSLAAMGTVDEREECLSPRPGQDTMEKCHQELAAVFTPELALAVYIPLCRIFGSIHMEESLQNDDLIRQLCAQQDSTMDQPPSTGLPGSGTTAGETPVDDASPDASVVEGLGSNVEVVGNRIQLSNTHRHRPPSPSPSFTQFGRGYRHDGILHIKHDDLHSHDMEASKRRHLHGNWLQYWEHELGLHERDTLFNFKQIRLQSFVGHSNSIRCVVPMDTENCFISSSKDKTVRLWALASCGDGTSKVPCQWTYQHHKKSVFSVAYVESMRQVASCDSTVHVWDPYTGVSLCQLESPRYSPAVALQSIPAPSPLILMGTTEATLRFLDLRTYKYGHEFRCSTGSLGLLRCVGVCPEGTWVAVGFSTGVISILELHSGLLLSSWKAHDGEILQLKAYSKHRLVSSSFDGTMKVWSQDGMEICPLKGPSDPVLCFSFYRDQVLSATAANRIGVHSSVSENAVFSSVKLRSDTFKGVLTCMAVLPLNRTLLLGSDNGTIQLLA